MKHRILAVKRNAPKGVFRRMRAVTGGHKQRAMASVASEMAGEDSGSRIARALLIIFIFHIIAIGLIFVHHKFLNGRVSGDLKSVKTDQSQNNLGLSNPTPQKDLPKISAGEQSYVVKTGDTYARIATAAEVDEKDLRMVNKYVDIKPGLRLNIPPKRLVASTPSATETRSQPSKDSKDTNRALVAAIPVDAPGAQRAQLVRSNTPPAEVVSASGATYVVKSGDNIWKIAKRLKVDQDALMKLNGITDARKMKIGMSLVIPK
jgi:LysM repeat protein